MAWNCFMRDKNFNGAEGGSHAIFMGFIFIFYMETKVKKQCWKPKPFFDDKASQFDEFSRQLANPSEPRNIQRLATLFLKSYTLVCQTVASFFDHVNHFLNVRSCLSNQFSIRLSYKLTYFSRTLQRSSIVGRLAPRIVLSKPDLDFPKFCVDPPHSNLVYVSNTNLIILLVNQFFALMRRFLFLAKPLYN